MKIVSIPRLLVKIFITFIDKQKGVSNEILCR